MRLHRLRNALLLLPLLLIVWYWSLQASYQAGEQRLLLRIRQLPNELSQWQQRQQDDSLLDLHAAAARRCLERLDRLYGDEARLWERYELLRRSADTIDPQS